MSAEFGFADLEGIFTLGNSEAYGGDWAAAQVPGSSGISTGEWDWQGVLSNVWGGVETVAKTITAFQSAKTAAEIAAEDRSFNRTLRGASLDVQRTQADAGVSIAKIQAATELAKAQQKLNQAQGLNPFYGMVGGGSSGNSWLLPLTIAGLVLAWWQLKKK